MNGRLSYGVMNNRHSMNPQRGVTRNHRSMSGMNMMNIAGTKRRKTSIMGNNSHKLSSDPRPLKNKEWIDNKLEILIEYLCSHGHDGGILSKKELNPPSTKKFQYITCFLFQQIDPSFEIRNKFEEACIAFYDKLGYPFKINKSSLKCIAPHSWPSLLAAISWMIELLTFAEAFDNSDNDDDNDNNNNDNQSDDFKDDTTVNDGFNINNILVDNYEIWLRGIDDEETISQRLLGTFTDKLTDLNENIINFDKANKQLIIEKERLQKQFPIISDLQDQRQLQHQHLSAIRKTSKQRDVYIDTLNGKLIKLQDDTKIQNTKIIKTNQQINKLKLIINQQTVSPDDVLKMNKQYTDLHAQNDELQLQKNELQTNIWNITEKLKQTIKEITNNINIYNNVAQKCEIIPKTASFSFNQDHHLKLLYNNIPTDINKININESQCNNLINQNLDRFNDQLQKLKHHFTNRLNKYEREIKEEQNKILQLGHDLQLQKDKINTELQRSEYVTKLYNEEKAKLLKFRTSFLATMEKHELELSKNQQFLDVELNNKKQELNKINNKYNSMVTEFKEIELEIGLKVYSSIQRVIKHRQNIRKTLKMVNDKLDDSLNKISFYHIQQPTAIQMNYNIAQDIDDEIDDDDDQIMSNHLL